MAARAFANVDPRNLAQFSAPSTLSMAVTSIGQMAKTVGDSLEKNRVAKLKAKKNEVAGVEASNALKTNRVKTNQTGESISKLINRENNEVSPTLNENKQNPYSFETEDIEYFDKPNRDDFKTGSGDFDRGRYKDAVKEWRGGRKETRKGRREEGILSRNEVNDKLEQSAEDGVFDISEKIKFGQIPKRMQKKILRSLTDANASIPALLKHSKNLNDTTSGLIPGSSGFDFNLGVTQGNGVFAIPSANGTTLLGTYITPVYSREEDIPEELRGEVEVGDAILNEAPDGYKGKTHPINDKEYVVQPSRIVTMDESTVTKNGGKFYSDEDLIPTLSMIEDEKPAKMSWFDYANTRKGKRNLMGLASSLLFENPELSYVDYKFLDKDNDKKITKSDMSKWGPQDWSNFAEGRNQAIEDLAPNSHIESAINSLAGIHQQASGIDTSTDAGQEQMTVLGDQLAQTDFGFTFTEHSTDSETGIVTFKGVKGVEGVPDDTDVSIDLTDASDNDGFDGLLLSDSQVTQEKIQASGFTEASTKRAVALTPRHFEKQSVVERNKKLKQNPAGTIVHVGGEGSKNVEFNDDTVGAAGYTPDDMVVLQSLLTSEKPTVLVKGKLGGKDVVLGPNSHETGFVIIGGSGKVVSGVSPKDSYLGKYLTSKGFSTAQIEKITANYSDMVKSGSIDLSLIALDQDAFGSALGNKTVTDVVDGVEIIPDATDDTTVTTTSSTGDGVEAEPQTVFTAAALDDVQMTTGMKEKATEFLNKYNFADLTDQETKDLVYSEFKFGPHRGALLDIISNDKTNPGAVEEPVESVPEAPDVTPDEDTTPSISINQNQRNFLENKGNYEESPGVWKNADGEIIDVEEEISKIPKKSNVKKKKTGPNYDSAGNLIASSRKVFKAETDVTPSEDNTEFISKHEGFRTKAYPDPGDEKNGPVTIGYGSTKNKAGKPFKLGDTITKKEAAELLKRDIKSSEKAVDSYSNHYNWTANERKALISFTYNLGSGGLKQLLYGNKAGTGKLRGKKVIQEKILLYNKNDGKVLKGLVKRREEESTLFGA